MRILSLFILSVGITLASFSATLKAAEAPITPATQAAYDLFEAMDLPHTYAQILIKMVDIQIQQNPKIGPLRHVMLSFFDKYMGWDSMREDMAKIYASKFTAAELLELKAFYETPVGKKAAILLPELSAAGAALGQRKVQENMGELKRMITEEIDKQEANKQEANKQ